MASRVRWAVEPTAPGASDWVFLGLELVESIDGLPEGTLSLATKSKLDPASMLGGAASVTMKENDRTRTFHLEVASVERIASRADATTARLRLVHPLAKLALASKQRLFLAKTTKQIVDEVLGAHAVSAKVKWKLAGTLVPRPQCVQRGETDLDFVRRLLEDEGIFTLPSPGDDGTVLVLADAVSAFEAIDGLDAVPLADARGDDGLFDLVVDHLVTSGAAELGAYAPEHPGLDLTARATLEDDPVGFRFEYPGTHATREAGVARAKIRAEELASQRVSAQARSAILGFAAGGTFTLAEAGPRDGSWLVRRVIHRFSAAAGQLDGTSYENAIELSPAAQPYRPRRRTERAHAAGVEIGRVTGPSGEEIHVDSLGRVTAKLGWDADAPEDEKASSPMRVVQPLLGASLALPRVGWEMLVAFVHGDPDRPIALARVYDAKHPAPTADVDAFELHTTSSPGAAKLNQIRVSDHGGSMKTTLHAAKDWDELVRGDRSLDVAGEEHVTIDGDEAVVIEKSGKLVVKKDRTAKTTGDVGIEVAKDRKLEVGGAEKDQVDGARSTRVDGDDAETIGGDLGLEVGKDWLERTGGDSALSVGATLKWSTKKGLLWTVGADAKETIAGARTTKSTDGTVSLLVADASQSTIGGALAINAKAGAVTSSRGETSITVGGVASFTAAQKIQIKAKTIKITVGGAANFLGGGGIATLTPASATFVGIFSVKGSGGVEIAGNPNVMS
jgi:type VI secretion system secreted protein VgrG